MNKYTTMLKTKKLLLSSLFPLFISVSLLNVTGLTANACPTGKPGDIDYIRRDNNRCEGIKGRQNITGSNSFELIAFSTTNLDDYPDTLKIIVPGTGKDKPTILMQSYSKNYLLDELDANDSPSGFIFDLKTNPVLQRVKIPLKSLLPLAFIEKNSRRIYYPVILDKASNTYQFVIYTRDRRTFPKVEIRQNGKVIPSNLKPRNIRSKEEIRFSWQPKNTPPRNVSILFRRWRRKIHKFFL